MLIAELCSEGVLLLQQSIQTMSSDAEFLILENIYDSASQKEPIRQRDLAQLAGASLGMTNSILKKLAQKGWIKIKKLNSRNIQYAVTIEGINEIILRSYRCFKKTIQNVVYFKEILENVILQASLNNIDTVVLVGASDLDFIIEHICHNRDLCFKKINSAKDAENYSDTKTFKIFSENTGEPLYTDCRDEILFIQDPDNQINSFYLSKLIISQAVAAGIQN